MKKTTFTNEKLLKYGALSAAVIGGVSDANAQVSFAAVNWNGDTYDSYTGNESQYDGSLWAFTFNDDFDFYIQVWGIDGGVPYVAGLTRNGASAWIGSTIGNYNYPSKLESGADINDTSTWIAEDTNYSFTQGTFNFNNGQYNGDQWITSDLGYLGYKLIYAATGDTHYGWIKMNVDTVTGLFNVESYALNLTGNEGLTAGEGEDQLSILDANYKNIKVTAFDNQINIDNTPKNINYNLYSVTGQLMLSGKATENTHSIFTNTLSKGIYIVELTNEKSQSVLRKKVLIK